MSDSIPAKWPFIIDNYTTSPTQPTFPALSINSSRSNNFSSKVSSVLSISYADVEIRDALHLLDERGIENNAETRRQFRMDVQKEVIESNGDVLRGFCHVANVCYSFRQKYFN